MLIVTPHEQIKPAASSMGSGLVFIKPSHMSVAGIQGPVINPLQALAGRIAHTRDKSRSRCAKFRSLATEYAEIGKRARCCIYKSCVVQARCAPGRHFKRCQKQIKASKNQELAGSAGMCCHHAYTVFQRDCSFLNVFAQIRRIACSIEHRVAIGKILLTTGPAKPSFSLKFSAAYFGKKTSSKT
jgi:hypothetical protein